MSRRRTRVDITEIARPVPIERPVSPDGLSVVSQAHSSRHSTQSWIFSGLEPLGALAYTVMSEFEIHSRSQRRKTGQAAVVAVRNCFAHIATLEDLREPVLEGQAVAWRAAIRSWWSSLVENPSLASSTCNGYLSSVSAFLRHLQASGLAPRFRLPARLRNATGRPRRTLAEPGIAPQLLAQPCPAYVEELGGEIEELWEKLGRSDDVASDPKLMADLLQLHLDVLRKCAELEARTIWADFEATSGMLKSANADRIARFLSENRGRSSRSRGSGRGSYSVFENRDDVLAYIDWKYGGIIPTQKEDQNLYRLIQNRSYTINETSRMLVSTPDSVISFIIIILIETAMNVAPLMDFSENDLFDSYEPGHKRLRWWKMRADGKVLERDFAIGGRDQMLSSYSGSVTAPRSFRCLVAMRAKLVDHVPQDEKDKLLLVLLGNSRGQVKRESRIAPINEAILAKAFKRFKDRHPILSKLTITLGQIRSTVALKLALETNGNIEAVNELLGHDLLSTSQRYVERAVIGRLNVEKARRAQDVIVIGATESRPDLRARLGYTAQQVEELLGRHSNKPWGIKCRDDKVGAAPGTTPGAPCTRTEHCPVCSQRFVVESDQSAAEMFALRRLILAEKLRLERMNPDRWQHVWAPTIVFLNVALFKMKALTRRNGRELAETLDYSSLVLE